MAVPTSRALALPEDQRLVLEALLEDFRRSWDEHQLGVQVRRLPPEGNPLRLPALIELVKADLQQQWRHGRHPRVEAYLKALPELGTPDTVDPDLIHAEYEARQRAGAPADLARFAQRFPRQAAGLEGLVAQGGRQTVQDAPDVRTTGGIDPPPCPPPVPAAGAKPLPEQFGRYRIVRKLGQGGMGSVYLAHDGPLDRQVALKVPHFTPEDGPEVLERFYREARAAGSIQHPNICQVFDIGQIDGTPFVTIAYIEGKTLAELIRDGQALPQRPAAALVRKLALALDEAHRRGVIHRDLKPANVMVTPQHEPVVMDFGLARRVDRQDERLTRSGAILGTPAYMPPEQVQGDTAAMGPGCDVYSLGVVLYELLTGQLPFRGPAMAVLGQILTQKPQRPSEHRPDLDPALEAICLKAMAKKVSNRYASMAAFARALGDYLGGEDGSPAGKGRKQDRAAAVATRDRSRKATSAIPSGPAGQASVRPASAPHIPQPTQPQVGAMTLSGGSSRGA